MTALPPPFPLAWPDGQNRTRNRERSQFRTKLEGAIRNVRDSLRLFATDSGKAMGQIEVTCNVSLMGGTPTDPGAAVWFVWDGQTRCIALRHLPKWPALLAGAVAFVGFWWGVVALVMGVGG